jgi:hypothetical protein
MSFLPSFIKPTKHLREPALFLYLPKSDRKSRDYFDFIAPLSTDPSSKFLFRNNPKMQDGAPCDIEVMTRGKGRFKVADPNSGVFD